MMHGPHPQIYYIKTRRIAMDVFRQGQMQNNLIEFCTVLCKVKPH